MLLPLLSFIHTLEHGRATSMLPVSLECALSHEVPKVLPGPTTRAAGLGRDHYLGRSGRHVAHSTRYIVVMLALDGKLVLHPKHVTGISIGSTNPGFSGPVSKFTAVLRVLGHAQVVGPTS